MEDFMADPAQQSAASISSAIGVSMGDDPMNFMGGGCGGDMEAPYAPPTMLDPMGGGGSGEAAMNGGYADPFQGMAVNDGGGGAAIPEVTALREWEEKHEQKLEERARQEAEEKKGRRQSASEELAKWYEDREATFSKRLEVNRSEEAEVETARMEAMEPGANPWERVVDLIDTNSRTADESRDTSRMRSLLIQLKSNPVVKAAA